MIEKEIDLSALDLEEESSEEKRPRSRNLGWRILVLLLGLLLVGGLGYALYSGSFSRLALQALREENEKLRERILAQTAENEEKDALIEARLSESGERAEELLRLQEEGSGKDGQLDALGAQSEERDARLQELDGELAVKDAQLQSIDGEISQKDEQLREIEGQIAEKDGELEALRLELDAAEAPLRYQEDLGEAVPAAALRDFALPEGTVLTVEEKTALLSQLLEGAILGADPAQTREDHRAYRIWSAEGQPIGTLAFEPAAGDGDESPVWTAVDERFDFSACPLDDYFTSLSLTLPADYTVYWGETPLEPEEEPALPYERYAACPQVMEYLPALVCYETPLFVGEPSLRILNEKGQELDLADLSESMFLDRCPEERREQIEAFLPEFFRLYLLFSADIRESASYYYGQLKPLVLPDSPLAARLRDAFEGLGYSAARKAELDSVTVHSITELGEGRYAVDLNYLSYITGHSSAFDPVADDLHILLILTLTEDGQLLAEDLYYLF